MNKKTVNIALPQIEGVELRSATVDLEKGVVVVEYEEEDIKKDISEIAVDLESAIGYLIEDLHKPAFLINKKHTSKVEAFSQLILLAEAWNAFDEFKPDWENQEQNKWYPAFKYSDGKLKLSYVSSLRSTLDIHISNLSFKTKERAYQFGKQFIELFRIVLTN